MSAPERGSVAVAPADAAGTVLDPTVRTRVRRNRTAVAVIVLLLLTAALLAWASGSQRRGYLDPEAADPSGSRALAQVLGGQGVDVRSVRTLADVEEAVASADGGPAATTLLVTTTDLLSLRMVDRLAALRPATLVLVRPDEVALTRLVPDVTATGDSAVEVRAPRCLDPVAVRADAALTGGGTYTGPSGSVACYPGDGGATLLRVPGTDGRPAVTVLGSGDAMTNDRVADEGNAALTLGLLGEHPVLVWYRPSLTDSALSEEDLGTPVSDLVPGWVPFLVAQLLVAGLVAALWRSRRLGPVTTEPLPVVVRAAEAHEGRARLYRRARARDRAADALRARALTGLARDLGLPRGAGAESVVAAAAARSGRAPADVAALLLGSAPTDDAALVRLADDLDALTREVRRS